MATSIKNAKIWKTVYHSITVASGIFGIVWTWTSAPIWWPTVVSLVVLVGSFILGVQVKFGDEPPPPPV